MKREYRDLKNEQRCICGKLIKKTLMLGENETALCDECMGVCEPSEFYDFGVSKMTKLIRAYKRWYYRFESWYKRNIDLICINVMIVLSVIIGFFGGNVLRLFFK